MANLIRAIVAAGGLALAYNGYMEGKVAPPSPTPPVVVPDDPRPSPPPSPVPTTIKVVTRPDERLAPVPTIPGVVSASAPIRQILLGHPDDAITLARTFSAWAKLIARDSGLKTTDEFQQAYLGAMQIIVQTHELAGKYQLNPAIDATIKAAFANAGLTDLQDNNRVKSGPWDAAAQQSAGAAFDAISYQCFRAFLDSQVKSQSQFQSQSPSVLSDLFNPESELQLQSEF